jgi:hypothetical protein
MGLYASVHTQNFFPPAATLDAQAWLRCRGYLGMEESIESLTDGAVIHFSAPARGKPMLILYADNGHKNKNIQQGLYDEFLKWHSRGMKHTFAECWYFDPPLQEPVLKKVLCEGEPFLEAPLRFYCAFDDVSMRGVDDPLECGVCNPCYPPGADRLYLSSVHHRSNVMVNLIEKAAEEFYHEIVLMAVGASHVQHLIDELPTRGIGLMVIETPQIYETHNDLMEISKRIQKNCDETERLEENGENP